MNELERNSAHAYKRCICCNFYRIYNTINYSAAGAVNT